MAKPSTVRTKVEIRCALRTPEGAVIAWSVEVESADTASALRAFRHAMNGPAFHPFMSYAAGVVRNGS